MSNITQKWVSLLIPYTNSYSAKSSVSELSRKTNIPQQTASRILSRLVKSNILSYETDGKNKKYYLEIRKNDTKIILNILESQKSLDFQIDNKKVAVIINELLSYCEGLIIFGSYASGKHDKESDLDLVIFNGNKKRIKKIINKQIIDINEHYIGYKEFEDMLKKRNALAIEILQNHVLFGDVSKIIEIFWRIEYERR